MRESRSQSAVIDQPSPCVRADGHSTAGFTLIEILVTMSIMTVLIALLLPGIRSVGIRSRQLGCVMNLRSIAFDFSVFADDELALNRGDDQGQDRFWLDTFQESQYAIDEFWRHSQGTYRGPAKDLGVMNCPEVAGPITKRRNTPCRSGAVGPSQLISYGFNLRLDSPEVKIGQVWTARPRQLSSRILHAPELVPLAFDIDGAQAQARDVVPYYSAPPLLSKRSPQRPYSDGNVWFPAQRHHGQASVAFIGGEVLSASNIAPEANVAWRWDYQQDFN